MAGLRLKEGEERLVGVIGDEDTVTGMLLAGVGDNSAKKRAEYGPNYFIATRDKTLDQLEEAFDRSVANDIRHLIENYSQTLPAVLEIPSRDVPYDASDDTVLVKVNQALGMGDISKKKKK